MKMYKEYSFDNSGPKIGKTELAKHETEASFSLPDQYREFMVACNGGTPTKSYFEIAGELSWVDRFYQLGGGHLVPCEDDDVDFLSRWNALLKDYIPKSHLVIGRLAGDSYLTIVVEGKKAGEVYSKEPDLFHTEDELPDVKQSLHRIAKDFDGFLELLREDED